MIEILFNSNIRNISHKRGSQNTSLRYHVQYVHSICLIHEACFIKVHRHMHNNIDILYIVKLCHVYCTRIMNFQQLLTSACDRLIKIECNMYGSFNHRCLLFHQAVSIVHHAVSIVHSCKVWYCIIFFQDLEGNIVL